MEGASDEQCYHFRRAGRARQVGEGLRVCPGNGRDGQEVVRLRALRDRLVGILVAPARQMRLRVGRDGLSPVPRAEVDGRRLRRRRRVQDAQASRRPRPQDRQARRAVPRRAARAGRGHRGARARCRVRGRAGFDAGPGRRARRRGPRQAKAVEVPAQTRVRLRREELRRPEAQPLDQGFLGVGRADRPRGRRRHGDAGPLLRARARPMPPRPRSRRRSRRWPSSPGGSRRATRSNASRASTPSPRSRSPARPTASRGSPPPRASRRGWGSCPPSTPAASRNSAAG